MAPIQLTRTVCAPVEQVFEVFSDVRGAADRIDGIERVEILTDGAIDKGTRFRETRVMFGREATEEMEFKAFQPNRSYTVAADSCGNHFETRFDFRAAGEQTRVEMVMTSHPLTWTARLLSPLAFLMRGTMKKCLESDLDQLKEFCETSKSNSPEMP